ncbi:MAG: DUF4179 domain-containing protein [Eubacteriales bacterium]|nr:DUF4179 domain-containing protein [Eubacteriales bacterium]
MKNEEYGFVELFNKIDIQLVKEAEGDWKKRKNVLWLRSGFAKAACAALCISLGALRIFQTQVQAAMKEFTGWVVRILQSERDLSPYSEVIDKQMTADGFTLCLEEVILSDNRIYAAVTINTEYPEGTVKGGTCVTVNGKDYPVGSVFDAAEDIGQNLGEQVPHHVYTFVLDEELPETVTDLELHFTAYQNYEDCLEEKNTFTFDFAFSATKEELEKDKIQVPVDKRITLEDGTAIRLKSLTLTKLDSRIEAELENIPENKKDRDAAFNSGYLEGWDSLGNPVWYICDTSNGKDIAFVCDIQSGMLPSVDSEWVELQYYFYEKVDEKDQRPIDTVDGEDMVMEDDGIPINRVDVGEPFRIEVEQNIK